MQSLDIKKITKRSLDIVISIGGLLAASFILLPISLIIFIQDWHSPFYLAKRVGKNGKLFTMLKLRTMVVNAESNKVDSTAANDDRITPIGNWVRRYKLDEVLQLSNVLIGNMSLVGPRPNVERETAIYTREEQGLLSVKPGITDISSIVFSDLAEIIKDEADPNIAYNQLVRPWKSRLGLFYIEKQSVFTDLKVIYLTVLSIFSRKKALQKISELLSQLGAPEEFIKIASRLHPLNPTPPPGASEIVQNRNIKANEVAS